MNPLAVLAFHDALRPQNLSVFSDVGQGAQRLFDLLFAELVGCLHAYALEHLVRVVVMMVVMIMVVVMIVVMASAVLAVMVMIMMMVVLVVMMVMVVVVMIVIMMMIVVVMVVVVLMMVMVVLMMVMVVIVIVVMIMMVVVVIMMMMVRLFLQVSQLGSQRVLLLHGLQNLRTGDLVPRRGHDRRFLIVLAHQSHCPVQLLLRKAAVWLRMMELACSI